MIDNYDILIQDMVPDQNLQTLPVFAEHEPVEVELAFKVKNQIGEYEGKTPVISTKGRKKEFIEGPQGKTNATLSMVNFMRSKTTIGRQASFQGKNTAISRTGL